jgi:hypothetical protein
MDQDDVIEFVSPRPAEDEDKCEDDYNNHNHFG